MQQQIYLPDFSGVIAPHADIDPNRATTLRAAAMGEWLMQLTDELSSLTGCRTALIYSDTAHFLEFTTGDDAEAEETAELDDAPEA